MKYTIQSFVQLQFTCIRSHICTHIIFFSGTKCKNERKMGEEYQGTLDGEHTRASRQGLKFAKMIKYTVTFCF